MFCTGCEKITTVLEVYYELQEFIGEKRIDELIQLLKIRVKGKYFGQMNGFYPLHTFAYGC